jgi:PKD repeat protein
VAPNADLLVADRIGNAFSTYIPWAAGLGAKVMLYEYGGWVWQYLDGSSNHEQLMDTASLTSGAVQVVPTGNLHGGGRHLQYSVASGTSVYTFNVPVLGGTGISMTYVSMVWLTPTNNMTVALTAPAGPSGVLPCTLAGGGWLSTTIGGHTVWCERAPNSSRGTALYNIFITRGGGVATGNWRMSVSNPSGSAQLTNFYIADDATSWSGGAAWINTGSGVEKHTATWPSTCDTCIGVASYATRAYATGTAGNISFFSGRGPRFFDGAQVVDVTAPGHYDVISTESKDASWGGPVGALGKYSCRSPASTWGCFGGTSAAGPHVAGVAALLMQFAANNGDPADIETAIQRSAVSDAFTGATPNDTWGYGKLDAYGALLNMMHDLGDAPDSTNHYGVSMSAYPRAFPGVQANFPTVYAGATPPGPLHRQAGSLASGPLDSCLGWRVSAEGDADKWFDEDAMQNISPTIDAPNGDDAGFSPWTTDDALAYGVGVLTHCVPSTFTYYVTLVTGTVSTHYVNVWLDWNRDGDWGDVFTCTAPVAGPASEWAVQNDMVTYTAAGLYTMTTSVFLPYQPGDPYDPIWMRMTLSEQPPPVDPATGRADGRGPAGGYAYGETEDRLIAYTALAGFQVATTTTCMSYTVAFTNTTTGSRPITYTWDFGDGTIVVTTTRTHPTHHYALPGNFAVVLTATNDPLGYMPYFTIYSSALTVQPSPKAGFTSNTPVRLGGTMVFTNVTTGAIAYNWDFGDGIGTSTAMNPTYVYNSGGVYTVTLTAANTQGCMNAYADRVTVTSPIYLPLVLRNYP